MVIPIPSMWIVRGLTKLLVLIELKVKASIGCSQTMRRGEEDKSLLKRLDKIRQERAEQSKTQSKF